MTVKKTPTRPRSLGRHLNFAAGAATAMCNRMLEAHGLTLPQWIVLAALWQRDSLTVGEISEYSGNNLPATSRILDRMIEKHLILRVPDETDRRAVRVSLTEKGEALRHLSGFHEAVNSALLDGIPSKDTDRLFALLERIESNAREHRALEPPIGQAQPGASEP